MNEIVAWGKEHALLLLLIFATGVSCGWLLLMRKRLKMSLYAVFPVAILHTLLGVLSVKVFAFLETGFDPDSIGNMSLFGGVFFMPLAYWLGAKLTKRPTGEVFDILTPCMIFTLMCARLNCLMSGCCIGLPVPGLSGARFPTREAEIVFYIILLALLCPRVYRGRTFGEAYPIYMISYGAFRFVTEFFRSAGTNALFHVAHLWALITLLIGVSIYAEIFHRKTNMKGRK